MLATVTFLLMMFAGGSGGGFYDKYFNIPGFELWRFINLAIFVTILYRVLSKPLSEAFKAKREEIRADLIRAEEEKKAAEARLAAAAEKEAAIEAEKAAILEKAKAEAEFEAKRIADAAEAEAKRLTQQAEAEVARLATQSRAELRRFSAEESIRLATEKLRTQIDPATNARLVKASINEIGGLN
jgi:F-type H+-transporting ATPase subunit b